VQSQGFIFLIGHPNNRQNFIPTTGSPSRCTRRRGPASRGGRVATCCGVGVHEKRELQERGIKKRGIKKRVNKFHRCGAKRPVGAYAGTRLGYIRTLYLFRRRSKLRACASQRWSLLPRLTSSAFGSLEMQSSVALLHNPRPCHKRPCRERHGYWARTPKTHRFAGLIQFHSQFHSQCREAVLLGVFAD